LPLCCRENLPRWKRKVSKVILFKKIYVECYLCPIHIRTKIDYVPVLWKQAALFGFWFQFWKMRKFFFCDPDLDLPQNNMDKHHCKIENSTTKARLSLFS
jgi:hypothetical protein